MIVISEGKDTKKTQKRERESAENGESTGKLFIHKNAAYY